MQLSAYSLRMTMIVGWFYFADCVYAINQTHYTKACRSMIYC